ncbi:MAG TPA: LysM peptidoglycan-binding domain-containing protein [Candidatus Coprenecus pullistercoris]|nr:LysM peptidoglycan-binding domain-containing protein [Candidatus Coprenecus pullistercoris]
MKRLLTALLCLSLLLPYSGAALAQEFVPTPVEISSEKVNLKGELHYVHKVLQGQTLYSISKAYGVTADRIEKANPSLSEGLKAGMLIYIPASPEQQEPSESVPSTDKSSATGKKYRKYKMKWYETLDDVAVRFNTSIEAIISLNDIDTTSKKRIRSVYIPDEGYRVSGNAADTSALRFPAADTSAAENSPAVVADTVRAGLYDKGPYIISVVLPFNVSVQTDGMNAYAADFYAGVLTAAADLKEQGKFDRFIINTVDINDYGSAWEMLSDGVLDGSELIIGPVSERDMQPVAAYAKRKGIPVVSPLDQNTAILAEDNPCFYFFPPLSSTATGHQLDGIAARYNADTTASVLVIFEDGYGESQAMAETVNGLESRGIPYSTFSYKFLEGRGADMAMRKHLDSKGPNIVLLPSMNEAFVTDALRNLNLIKSSGRYRIEVFGQGKWKGFDTMETNYLHALGLRMSLSYHIDYNRPEVMDFIHRYAAAFNTEPTSFSYQGYDILTFFVEAMNAYGRSYPSSIINERKSLLQSDVLFLPYAPGSGFYNGAFRDICFTEDWNIIQE